MLLATGCTLAACKDNSSKKPTDPAITALAPMAHKAKQSIPEEGSVLANDDRWYGDSLFKGHSILLKQLFAKYIPDSCHPMVYKKQELRDGFEGFHNIGDVNKDGKADSVFVMDPLSTCDYNNEQSYYFTDPSLPRIISESSCSHPTNFFKAPDIDEDGICEVGYLFSSCASRYKSLRIYQLKNNQWHKIAVSEFDFLTQDPTGIVLARLVRKIRRNQFAVRNFYDGKKYWNTVILK
jgi:hypothetical protein